MAFNILLSFLLVSQTQSLAQDLVDIAEFSPRVFVEMRYFSNWNFTGRRVPGYSENKCYLTPATAAALAAVQDELLPQGYSLLVFDCYRPQQAVDEFLRWSTISGDQLMQKIFYPTEPKDKLVERGYISAHSNHTLGTTVDLTIVKLANLPQALRSQDERLRFQEQAKDCRNQNEIESTGQLDMGTIFDCFSENSAMGSPQQSAKAKANRQFLKSTMQRHGFKNYPKEWWHYQKVPVAFW